MEVDVRVFDPDTPLLITNHCEQRRLFLLPRPSTNRLIRGWLARSLSRYRGIELYAFAFLSNHFHLLLRDTSGELPAFMGYFQRCLARAVNEELDRGSAHVFAGPYDAVPVLTDADFEVKYAYVLTNAVKEDLVERAGDGPFFTSLQMSLDERPREFPLVNRTRRNDKSRGGRSVSEKEVTERFALSLAVAPAWREWSIGRRQERIEGLVRANEVRHRRRRRAEGKSVLGSGRVLQHKPWMRARERPSSPRLRVHSRNPERAKEYSASIRAIRAAYGEAYGEYLAAARNRRRAAIEWPPWTYPPSSLEPILPSSFSLSGAR